MLSGGDRVLCKTIFPAAKEKGISERTVNEAKKNIPDIVTAKTGKGWTWQMPE